MIYTSEVKMNTESKRKFYQYVQESKGSADNGQPSSSQAYDTVRISSEKKVKRLMNVEEVKQLKKRLTHLEEETHMMKQEMLQSIAERKTLLNDVCRHLKLIQSSLNPRNQILGSKFCKKGRMTSDGLSEILSEDWNPSLVIRGGMRANSVAVPDTAESAAGDSESYVAYLLHNKEA